MWIIAGIEEYQEGSDLTPKLNSSLGKPKAVTQVTDISGKVKSLVVLTFHPIYRL